MAQVTIAFDTWKGGHVAPSHHEVPVNPPKSMIKIEAVSNRLKRELIHPNRTSTLWGIRFSPDGKRLIAAGYPGGVFVVWDVATGKELTTIETGAKQFFLTPDWQTLLVPRGKRKREPVEQGGKRLFRWEFEGDVRAFDVATGQLRRTYRHQPQRCLLGMQLSPDGTTFATFEELPGIWEGRPKSAASLWDVRTGLFRHLPGDLRHWAVYSPDGKTLAAPAELETGRAAVRFLDVATAQERVSIPVLEEDTRIGYMAYSPDGSLLVGQVRNERKTGQHWLKFWDPTTSRELASFEGEKKAYYIAMTFSPDGRTLAATASGEQQCKLSLFDVSLKKPTKTLILGQKVKGERLGVHSMTFSPDGKWLALLTQAFPEDIRGDDEPEVQDLPQARIHLVDIVAEAIRETLIAPQGIAGSACFGPDGRTLATGGHGRVLLWDLTKLPGTTDGAP